MKIRAFTLLELLLTVAMLGIMGTIMGPILANTVKASTLIWGRRTTLTEAKSGLERMIREIRLIPNTGALTNLGSTNFQFQYPLGTYITYSISGTNLLRNSDILMAHVTGLTFSYYDASGNVTAITSNVRSVGIQITVFSPQSNSSLSLRTRVFLRNTGNDYDNFTSP